MSTNQTPNDECSESQGPLWIFNVQQQERQLLAFEIHDGLVQHLAAALMHVQAAESQLETDQDNARAECQLATKLLRVAVDEARRLMNGLRPELLEKFGLVVAVGDLAESLRKADIQVEVMAKLTQDRLPQSLENAAYRILQESLTNIRQHSQAKSAKVKLSQDSHHLHLIVSDDGIGFAPADVPPARFGLRGIRERAKIFGGTAVITSQVGQGTRIEVKLPLRGI